MGVLHLKTNAFAADEYSPATGEQLNEEEKYMADFIGYMVQKTADTEQDTKRLSELLAKVGIRVALINRETVTLLTFSIDHDKYESVVNRHAGRNKKNPELRRTSEVFVFAKNHSAKETAEFCQISLRTYQRRLKLERDRGTWDINNNNYFGAEG